MRKPIRISIIFIIVAIFALAGFFTPAQAQVVNFDPPDITNWAPEGCRAISATDPVLPSRAAWRNLHSDQINTDEISIALAPVFEFDWIAEADQFHVMGPVFDRQGNLYISGVVPHDGSVLVSVNPNDGSRRWAIPGTGAPSGWSSPMVLDNPNNPGQEIIYLAFYNRVIAVHTDGSIVWDVPTGLTLGTGDLQEYFTLGTNYLPQLDAIVGLTVDGYIYMVDRETGELLLDEPYQLPGERSPIVPPRLPAEIMHLAELKFDDFVNLPYGSFRRFIDMLIGNNVEVANMFSIDANTNRIWVAATAPDGEDGSVDGVSEFGALYGLDVVSNVSGYEIIEGCHRYFAGGSASTPALRADGSRVYFGDNFGKLISIDNEGNTRWELDVGSQIIGSIAVSSDNEELYAGTEYSIFKVFDRGDHGEIGWESAFDVFETVPGLANFNLLLVSIGANGVSFHAGVGPIMNGFTMPLSVGVGLMDRETGEVRYFAEGREESTAVMNTGPDGAIYLGHSPARRIVSRVLYELGEMPFTPEIIGGIGKYAPQRFDLLIRDAAHAAADRATNADKNSKFCLDSAFADITQIQELIDQARSAAYQGIANGDITIKEWKKAEKMFNDAEAKLTLKDLKKAAHKLGKVVDLFRY